MVNDQERSDDQEAVPNDPSVLAGAVDKQDAAMVIRQLASPVAASSPTPTDGPNPTDDPAAPEGCS